MDQNVKYLLNTYHMKGPGLEAVLKVDDIISYRKQFNPGNTWLRT